MQETDSKTSAPPSPHCEPKRMSAALLAHLSLPIYLVIITVQSAFFFTTFENYPHAGICGTDQIANYSFVRSICLDRDLDLHNEFYDLNFNNYGLFRWDSLPKSPHKGRLFNRYPIGYSLLVFPFFCAAHALTLLSNALGLGPLEPNGYSLLYEIAAVVATLFWAALSFWSMRRILLRWFSHGVASATTFALMLSYQGSYYTIWAWANNHIPSLFLFNFLILLGFRVQDRRAGTLTWAALGAVTGLAGLTRTENLLFALLPFLAYLHAAAGLAKAGHWREARRLSFQAATAPLACILVFSLQFLVWSLLWGEIVKPSWLLGALKDSEITFNWTEPVFSKILFIPYRGLFYWSPILLLGLLGLVRFSFSERAGAIPKILLLQLLALTYLYASWSVWDMGYSYGARGFIAVTGIFGIGLGAIVERLAKRPRLTALLLAAFILWNQAMLWMFMNGYFTGPNGLYGASEFHALLPFEKMIEKIMDMTKSIFGS